METEIHANSFPSLQLMTMTRSESILLQMQQDSRTNNICFHDQSFAHGLHHGQSSNRRASEPTSLVNNGNDKEETTQMIGVLSYSSNPYLATPKAILSETNSSPQRPAASSLSNSIAQVCVLVNQLFFALSLLFFFQLLCFQTSESVRLQRCFLWYLCNISCILFLCSTSLSFTQIHVNHSLLSLLHSGRGEG